MGQIRMWITSGLPVAIMQGQTRLAFPAPENPMKRAAILTGLLVVASILAIGCGTDPDAPSGVCATSEQTDALLYGPPLAVSVSGDTATYTWGSGQVLFIAKGSTCVEQSGSGQ